MEPKDFSGILTEGGTILGTSRQRYIPGKDIIDENGESMIPAMRDTYNRLNLDCLVIMGGNGTQKSAKLIADAGMNVVTPAQDHRQRHLGHGHDLRLPERGRHRHECH